MPSFWLVLRLRWQERILQPWLEIERSRAAAMSTNQAKRSFAATPLREASSTYLARPHSVLIQRKAWGELMIVCLQ